MNNYKCPHCSYKTAYKSSLEDHLRTSHGYSYAESSKLNLDMFEELAKTFQSIYSYNSDSSSSNSSSSDFSAGGGDFGGGGSSGDW